MLSPCERCGVVCKVGEKDERGDVWPLTIMIPTQTKHGLCVTCAAHWWLWTVDGIRWAIGDSEPWVLGLEAVQEKLTPILARMHPEFGALDWGKMLAQWSMPWPKGWALPKDGING